MQIIKFVSAAFLLSPVTAMVYPRSCTGGEYQCGVSGNGTSIVQVCNNGNWLLVANCKSGTECEKNAAGGCTCA
ncbi:hypothetical protein F5Y15DRAFT_413808 [Xylariaceae sp. FL0016]|nr:hypothetical protein F5Y15DRAFT_413808 [Xylariaceae sp. FL0016]